MTADRVSSRIAALALDRSGHVPGNVYAAIAVRGGLLVDLAAAGRLIQTEASIELDPTPVGYSPADRALAELQASEEESLDWWLEHSRVGPGEVAVAEVGGGAWEALRPLPWHRARRYAPAGRGDLGHDRRLVAGAATPETVADAAVLALAAAAVLPGVRVPGPDDALLHTGSLRWICQLGTAYLEEARARGIAVSRASQTALWSGMPY